MTDRYFKATRPDGRDFQTGTVDYAAALVSGELVTHPRPHAVGAAGYLSVSVSAADCTGMEWPCRLFEVEPVAPWTPAPAWLPSKRACHSLRVVRELPAHEALGPQGVHVAALIDSAGRLTGTEIDQLAAARDAVRNDVWDAVWDAVWTAARAAARNAAADAAWDAVWDAAVDAARDADADAVVWNAARAAVRALVARDLIDAEHYDTLTLPWRAAVGPIHPDDPDATPKETK